MSISIELGHVTFQDPRSSWSGVLRTSVPSVQLATTLQAALLLRQPSTGKVPVCSTVALIDDKAVPRSRRPMLSRYRRLLRDTGVDFIGMESELSEDAPALRDRLPPNLVRGVDRFLREHSVLPCSVDIAIWYSLRLGLIGIDAHGGRLIPVSPRARSGKVPPVADALVSILDRAGGQTAIHERKADRLLRAAWGPEVVLACRRVYYDVEQSSEDDLDA